MTVKLFTIGDSISQGFMSGAAANTHLSYSALLASALGETNHRYLYWDPRYKTKVDLERILRKLERQFGSNIRVLEWAGVLPTINGVLDQAEEYFELGEGRLGHPVPGSIAAPDPQIGFHNVAVEGMDVADAFMVTAKKCKKVIAENRSNNMKDNWLQGASYPFYRNAYRVLNPKGTSGEGSFGDFTAVDWLEYTGENEGVENVCLFLGANNALGTILDLNIVQSNHTGKKDIWNVDRETRQKWNLWHPDHFRQEYKELLRRVTAALEKNKHEDWHVFVATVPMVTIAPLAKGVGEKRIVTDPSDPNKKSLYFQYYTYFPLTLESALATNKFLKFDQALFIDETIAQFNQHIRDLVKETNGDLGTERFHIVDVSKSLSDMAWKRNMGSPTYKFPEEIAFIYPRPNTKYYHATDKGEVTKGGIFSLDGVHPTAIGQGLLAHEFLKEIKNVYGPNADHLKLDWDKILRSDTLRNQPITLMQELYEHDKFIELIANVCRSVRGKI